MNHRKILLIVAGFLAVGAIFHHLHLRDEIRTKVALRDSLQVARLEESRDHGRRSTEEPRLAASSTASHIAGLLRVADGPLSSEIFDEANGGTWSEQHFALAGHSESEARELLAGMKSPPFSRRSLDHLRTMISRIFPSEADFGTQIEEGLSSKEGKSNYWELFNKWLQSDPQAAQKWLDAQLLARTLDGTGIDDKPLEKMALALMRDLFLKSPAEAAPYYKQLSDTAKFSARMMVAQDLVQAGEKEVGEFLSQVDDKEMRWAVVDQLVTSKGRAIASKEDILAMTGDLDLSADDKQRTLQTIISQPDLFKEESLQ